MDHSSADSPAYSCPGHSELKPTESGKTIVHSTVNDYRDAKTWLGMRRFIVDQEPRRRIVSVVIANTTTPGEPTLRGAVVCSSGNVKSQQRALFEHEFDDPRH